MNPKKIRKEIAIRTRELIAQGTNDSHALNLARQEANTKYGKDWRDNERTPAGGYNLYSQDDNDKSWNEKNLDGSFAYNGVTDDF